MRSILRETQLEHLLEVVRLTRIYSTSDSRFSDEVLSWAEDVTASLKRYRDTSTSFVATQQARIVTVRDGGNDDAIDMSLSKSKRVRIVSYAALSRIEQTLRRQVEEIDSDFEVARDKIAQLVAMTSTSRPIPLPPTVPREQWLLDIWRGLAGGETSGMYSYLNASLPLIDRLYILDKLLDNLIDGAGAAETS